MDACNLTETPNSDIIRAILHGERNRAVDAAKALHRAAPLLIEVLTFHWGTGQGTRVRHVLWSLYTCSHSLNLGDACSGLDSRIADALLAAVAARLVLGAEIETTIGDILRISGEFGRFDERERSTPEHLPVIYPPPPLDSRTLRQMADAMDYSVKGRLAPSFRKYLETND